MGTCDGGEGKVCVHERRRANILRTLSLSECVNGRIEVALTGTRECQGKAIMAWVWGPAFLLMKG